MLALNCGLILDTETKKAKQDFEIRVNMLKTMLDQIEHEDAVKG